jgi:hypothetical protein
VTVIASVAGVRTAATFTLTVTRAGADVRVSVSGPSKAADGSSFTETVTVTNNGPLTADAVLTGLTVQSGLTVTADDGGSRIGPVIDWTAASLASGKSVTYTVKFSVAAKARGTVTIAVASASRITFDPDLANNVATTRITLG